MKLEEYLKTLEHWQGETMLHLPMIFMQEIGLHWFQYIAPFKAEQYGTECWERLGPKGLIVDVSACHYRWRRIKRASRIRKDGSYQPGQLIPDVLHDQFGYAIMLAVALQVKPTEIDWEIVEIDQDPRQVNEYIIRMGWDRDDYRIVPELAIRMAVKEFFLWRNGVMDRA